MRRRGSLVALLALVAAFAAQLPAAAADVSRFVADPPTPSWQPVAAETGPVSAQDLYGAKAKGIQGFKDAYRKVWTNSNQVLGETVELYSSAIWAAARFGESRSGARANKAHNSFKDLPTYGTGGYEVTDPADSSGFIRDTIVFNEGDYIAVVTLAAKRTPDHELLVDQARKQLQVTPAADSEYTSIGVWVIAGGLICLLVVLGAVTVIILLVRRGGGSSVPASGTSPGYPQAAAYPQQPALPPAPGYPQPPANPQPPAYPDAPFPHAPLPQTPYPQAPYPQSPPPAQAPPAADDEGPWWDGHQWRGGTPGSGA